MVVEEERVVAQRAHAEADLRRVKQVLQRRRAPQIDPVRDVFAQQQRGREVVDVAGLARVRAQREGVEPTRLAEAVERVEVGVDVEGVVGEGGVVLGSPLSRGRRALRGAPLGLGLVVDEVEAGDVAQEGVELGREGGRAGVSWEVRQ